MDDESHLDDYVRRAVAGEAGALERLLLHHDARLLRRIDQGLPMDVERTQSPEDVLQDVFTDVFRQIHTVQIPTAAGFRRWVDAITHNRLVNIIKEARALKRGGGAGIVDGTAADFVLAFLSRETASPRQKMINHEQAEVIRAAFDRLPEDYQQVLKLRIANGLDYDQIAARMNRNAGAVRMLAMRAMRHLRTLVPNSDGA